MPFKSLLVNWLDISFMLNALFMSSIALHQDNLGEFVASIMSILAAMLVFWCIVGYHAWHMCKRLKLSYDQWKACRCAVQKETIPEESEITQTSLVISTSSHGVEYEECVDYYKLHPSKFRDSILNHSVADTD